MIFFDFCSESKIKATDPNCGDKIKRTEMIADYQEGGLKMLDIMEFNKALDS